MGEREHENDTRVEKTKRGWILEGTVEPALDSLTPDIFV
jgi:hypothetical protein